MKTANYYITRTVVRFIVGFGIVAGMALITTFGGN